MSALENVSSSVNVVKNVSGIVNIFNEDYFSIGTRKKVQRFLKVWWHNGLKTIFILAIYIPFVYYLFPLLITIGINEYVVLGISFVGLTTIIYYVPRITRPMFYSSVLLTISTFYFKLHKLDSNYPLEPDELKKARKCNNMFISNFGLVIDMVTFVIEIVFMVRKEPIQDTIAVLVTSLIINLIISITRYLKVERHLYIKTKPLNIIEKNELTENYLKNGNFEIVKSTKGIIYQSNENVFIFDPNLDSYIMLEKEKSKQVDTIEKLIIKMKIDYITFYSKTVNTNIKKKEQFLNKYDFLLLKNDKS